MIPKDLPVEIALQEHALNLENQYSSMMRFLLFDAIMFKITSEYMMKSLREAGLL